MLRDIKRLFSLRPTNVAGNGEQQFQNYVEALRDTDPRDLERVVDDIRDGVIDVDWVPNTGQLVNLCRDARDRRELIGRYSPPPVRIPQLPPPERPPLSDDDRARMQEKLSKVFEDLDKASKTMRFKGPVVSRWDARKARLKERR